MAQGSLIRPKISFWRTHAGAEVDLVIGDGKMRSPIEIKSSAASDHHGMAGLRVFMKDLAVGKGWIVRNAPERRSLGGIDIVPWGELVAGRIPLPF